VVACSDNRRYSWQVAPQQSPLPLLTGVAKIMEIKNLWSGKYKENVKKIFQKMQRKKEAKKEKIEMGNSP